MQIIDSTWPDATTSPASEPALRAASATDAYLQVVFSPDSAGLGSRVALSHELLLIGRELHQDGLRLVDARLSRVHARVTFDGRAGAYRIGDAESRNGIFVNGRRVDSALLARGDVIRLGDSLLVYDERDAMDAVRDQVSRIASTTAHVLLRGESGTGKELLARALHEQSGRPGAFVAINCAALPSDLLISELFGHAKGAFSGAVQARKGAFAAAAQGTLFLDEIGDCPMPAQAALLRALQEKAVRPLGVDHEQQIDVRVVSATNVALEKAIEAGRFRPDLHARLAQVSLQVPPLRDRRGETVTLFAEACAELGHRLELKADACEALLCWHWPSNVRELQALILSCGARGASEVDLKEVAAFSRDMAQRMIDARALGAEPEQRDSQPRPINDRARLQDLLEEHAGNVTAVAGALGKPRAQVYRWMKALGLSATRFRR